MRRLLAATILVLSGWAGAASATPIGPGAFGALVQVESFEGQTPGPNIALGLGQSLLEPATTLPWFGFPTPVWLTSPTPNPGYDQGGAFIHDFALGNDVQNNWGGSRIVNDGGDVPFGDAYLGAFAPGAGTTSFELTFGYVVDRVGAYVTGAVGTTVRMDVYDLGGALLESRTVNTVNLNQWQNNFLGIQNLAGIKSVVFTGADFGIDRLMFEPNPITVPEPGTLPALALGLVGLLGLAMLGRGRPAVARGRAR
jgi:hypothetical protein